MEIVTTNKYAMKHLSRRRPKVLIPARVGLQHRTESAILKLIIRIIVELNSVTFFFQFA